MKQTERMRLAMLIENIASTEDESFCANDAADIFKALEDLPIDTRIISGSMDTKSGGGQITNTGAPSPSEESERKFEIGKSHEFRCGKYVITKSHRKVLNVRHVADVMALSNNNEVLILQRGSGHKYTLFLNNPKTLKIPFIGTVSFNGSPKLWKVSSE